MIRETTCFGILITKITGNNIKDKVLLCYYLKKVEVSIKFCHLLLLWGGALYIFTHAQTAFFHIEENLIHRYQAQCTLITSLFIYSTLYSSRI